MRFEGENAEETKKHHAEKSTLSSKVDAGCFKGFKMTWDILKVFPKSLQLQSVCLFVLVLLGAAVAEALWVAGGRLWGGRAGFLSVSSRSMT